METGKLGKKHWQKQIFMRDGQVAKVGLMGIVESYR